MEKLKSMAAKFGRSNLFADDSWVARHLAKLIAFFLVVNLALLLTYQANMAADFPFADEWGYLTRLRQLPAVGLGHYLFDPYQNYLMPFFLFIWYGFYSITHLDLMALRYSGAVVSALVATLLSVMLYRRSPRLNAPAGLAILCAPFVICSLNHAAAYSQAIESLAEPLLFGLVLATTLAAEATLQPGRKAIGVALCIAGALLASGIYAPPVALLAAIVAARFLLRPRLDWALAVLAIFAVAFPLFYLKAGGTSGSSGFANIHPGDLPKALYILLGLTGNAVVSPGSPSLQNLTLVLGGGILLIQLVAVLHVMRLPVEERGRFMVPMVLTLYSGLVFVEILAARIGMPDVAFTPRYSTHMLGGVVSVLFWAAMLNGPPLYGRWLASAAVTLIISGVIIGEAQGTLRFKPVRRSMAEVRRTLLSLNGDPDPVQQREMFVTPAMLPLVYPGRQFLQERHLALYKNGDPTAVSLAALAIDDYGPRQIRAAGTQPPIVHPAIWVRVNGDVAVAAHILVDGQELTTVVNGPLLTAELPASVVGRPGTYRIQVAEVAGGRTIRSNQAEITVR